MHYPRGQHSTCAWHKGPCTTRRQHVGTFLHGFEERLYGQRMGAGRLLEDMDSLSGNVAFRHW